MLKDETVHTWCSAFYKAARGTADNNHNPLIRLLPGMHSGFNLSVLALSLRLALFVVVLVITGCAGDDSASGSRSTGGQTNGDVAAEEEEAEEDPFADVDALSEEVAEDARTLAYYEGDSIDELDTSTSELGYALYRTLLIGTPYDRWNYYLAARDPLNTYHLPDDFAGDGLGTLPSELLPTVESASDGSPDAPDIDTYLDSLPSHTVLPGGSASCDNPGGGFASTVDRTTINDVNYWLSHLRYNDCDADFGRNRTGSLIELTGRAPRMLGLSEHEFFLRGSMSVTRDPDYEPEEGRVWVDPDTYAFAHDLWFELQDDGLFAQTGTWTYSDEWLDFDLSARVDVPMEGLMSSNFGQRGGYYSGRITLYRDGDPWFRYYAQTSGGLISREADGTNDAIELQIDRQWLKEQHYRYAVLQYLRALAAP